MKNKTLNLTTLSAAILLSASTSAFAWEKDIPHEGNIAYVQDTDNDIVRDRWGGCVRTRDWSEALAIKACDPGLKKFQVNAAPVAKAEPVAAPAPKPAAKKEVPKALVVVPAVAIAASSDLSFSGFFEIGGANLTEDAKTKLDAYVDYLNAHPDASIKIEGHTDARGRASVNQKLSERRAESVQAYLVSKGVAASRVEAVGLGEAHPVADNGTSEGRAKNRRVELIIND